MTKQAEHGIWSYATGFDVEDSLSAYLKFLKSKPPISEILFFLQSTYLVDYDFESIAIYLIDAKKNTSCVETSNHDVLGKLDKNSLVEIKKMIPVTQPSQNLPVTQCILSLDGSMIFFPFSRQQAVDCFILHHSPDSLSENVRTDASMKFLSLVQALTAHHLVVSGALSQAAPAVHNFKDETFNARQKEILDGMIEGKTNYQLASELGYSVSTIRHETMRIFRILGVSDRKDAAQLAMKRKLGN
jgi:DNA-binding CsgD family transcriptional regulator